jgi:heme-degrading monooxygenase HmoA
MMPLTLVALLGACAHAPARQEVPPSAAHIARVWHGRTPNAKAEEYTRYISAALPKFRALPGNRGYQLLRETVGEETHFTVISYWESLENIHAYAGEDIRKVHHLPRDSELLIDPEQTVMNYDVLIQDFGPGPAGGEGGSK